MGQKTNPVGIRLGINKTWTSNWYAEKMYPEFLNHDLAVREYLANELAQASVSRIQIDRPAKNAKISVYSARPGVIIGKGGEGLEKLRLQASKLLGVPVHISIEEVRKPELDAKLVAES